MTRPVHLFAFCALLVPALAGAGDTFACRDSEGNWILGNVEQHRCVGKVRKFSSAERSAVKAAVRTQGMSTAEAKAILLAPSAYREQIRRAASRYKLSEELLHAVMAVESGFRPDAVSSKGAMGLMQLMPGTAKDMYVRDAMSPEQNIEGGARYLRVLANRYDGDLVKTLAAYNAGPEAVDRARGVPRYAETQEYVDRVLRIYERLKTMKGEG